MPCCRNIEPGRVGVLLGRRLAVSPMIIEEHPTAPLFTHQDKAARLDFDVPGEFRFQPTQADRRVETPRSEIVRVHRQAYHPSTAVRHSMQGQSDRK